MKLLSNKEIEALEPPADKPRHVKFAEGVDGAWLRIAPKTGRRTFLYTYAGRTLTLGSYPLIDSAAALKMIRAAQVSRDQGVDPALAKKARKAQAKLDEENRRKQAETDQAESMGALVALYLEACREKGERAWAQKESVYRRFVLPRWKDTPVKAITPRNVDQYISDINKSHGAVVSRSAYAKLSVLMRYARRRRWVDNSPCGDVELPGRVSSRDRLLSDQELALIWEGAGRLGYPDAPFVKLLLLTAQRRSQVAGLRRSEVDLAARTISWPAEKMKSNQPHTLPILDECLRVILSLPMLGADSYLLSYQGGRAGARSYARAKQRLDAAIAQIAAERNVPAPAPWTFHDLRRTARSRMADAGVSRDGAELVLAHKLGDQVSQTYNRSVHLGQKADALQKWEQYVLGVVERFQAAA